MALSGLAGMALGHAVSNHFSHKQQQKEEIPNGCFKQTLREPDPQDPHKFIETERLVCPNGAAQPPIPAPMPAMPIQYAQPGQIAQQPQQPQGIPPQYPQQFMQPGFYLQQQQQQQQQPQQTYVPQQQPQPEQQQPQQPQQPQAIPAVNFQGSGIHDSLLQIQRPGDLTQYQQQQAHEATNGTLPANGTLAQQPAQTFIPQQPFQQQAMQPAQSFYPAQPAYPAQSPYPAQPNYPPQPNQAPVQPNQTVQPAQNNSQVFVLSKKTGYYGKSSSDQVMSTNALLMLAMAFLLKWLH